MEFVWLFETESEYEMLSEWGFGTEIKNVLVFV